MGRTGEVEGDNGSGGEGLAVVPVGGRCFFGGGICRREGLLGGGGRRRDLYATLLLFHLHNVAASSGIQVATTRPSSAVEQSIM